MAGCHVWNVLPKVPRRVYGSRGFISSEITIPSSKSFAQRAIIAAALAGGVSRLSGYSPCGDNEAALAVARALGARVSVNGTDVEIEGIAAEPGCLCLGELHTGESGLLTRLMLPLLPLLSSSPVLVTGEKTLVSRPMKGAREMMSEFGVKLESGDADCRIPLTVSGPLACGKAEISGRHGSQLVSGLLMSLPLCQGNSNVTVKDPKSIPYMFITLDVLKKFGVKVSNEMLGDKAFAESGGDWAFCDEIVFKVRGGQRYRAADIALEGDSVFGKVVIEGLDTTSLQADLTIMDVLMEAGASLSQTDGERGPVTVQRSPLRAFEVDASNCPDLFPIVSVLAAFCQGTSRISGVDRLAHKESDRGKAILRMLRQMGVSAEIRDNCLEVEGHSLASRLLEDNLLKGGNYTSCHDHRMVMALKVAGLGADSRIEIDDEECVGKSFPDFMERFSMIVQ